MPPTRPPAGTYDPNLDAEERGSNRGLGDLTQDTDRNRERSNSDYLLARGDTERQRDEGLADLLRTRTRGVEDFGLQRTRGVADYDRQGKQGFEDIGQGGSDYRLQRARGLEDIGRQRGAVDLNYNRLGGNQAQQINRAGAGNTSGAFAQAAAKRAENQGRDLESIATGENRLVEDTTQAEGQQLGRQTQLATRLREGTALGKSRLLEDTTRGEGRLVEDTTLGETRLRGATDRRLGELATTFRRGNEDRDTTLTRAGRENVYFGQDTAAQRFFQAKQTGYTPPLAPKPKPKPRPRRRPGIRQR